MNLKTISRLMCGCTWALALIPGNVSAQAVASSNDAQAEQTSSGSEVEEIIVTARQQNESLKNVPASVAVLSADTIENTKARVAVDFVNLTSGVTIQTATTDPSDVSINIRGLNSPRDAENNIALVVDGVLKTSIASTNEPQGALAQVEILKGPQGAIYGRNASAGAIVITTKKPTPELSGQIKGRVANDNTYLMSGLLSGPAPSPPVHGQTTRDARPVFAGPLRGYAHRWLAGRRISCTGRSFQQARENAR